MSKKKKPFNSPRNGDAQDPKDKEYQKNKPRGKGKPVADSTPNDPLNDLSWYTRFPELIAPVSRVAFPYKVGMDIDAGTMTRPTTGAYPQRAIYHIPGVAAIHYAYTFGYSDNNMSPASIAAADLWSQIRANFSGSLDEDPPDLIMYVIALDMIHAYIAELKRMYGLANAYTGENMAYPTVLWQAISPGMTLQYVQKNMMQFESIINTLVDSVNVFNVPYILDIFNRHRWMNENVYMDEPSLNSQTFVFVPEVYYQIDETGPNGTRLTPKSPSYTTLDNAFKFGMDMIHALKSWEDALTIKGHIERAFADTPFYKAEIMPHGYKCVPVYVEEVLMQIENLTIQEGYTNFPAVNQDPTTNTVLFEPTVVVPAASVELPDPLLNIHSSDVVPAEVIIASRLTSYADYSVSGAEKPLICATEVVNGIYLYGNSGFLEGGVKAPMYYDNFVAPGGSDPQLVSTLAYQHLMRELAIETFVNTWNHYPMRWHHFASSAPAAIEVIETPLLSVDLANIAPIRKDLLRQLHRVCLYSEFNCFGRV